VRKEELETRVLREPLDELEERGQPVLLETRAILEQLEQLEEPVELDERVLQVTLVTLATLDPLILDRLEAREERAKLATLATLATPEEQVELAQEVPAVRLEFRVRGEPPVTPPTRVQLVELGQPATQETLDQLVERERQEQEVPLERLDQPAILDTPDLQHRWETLALMEFWDQRV
jgi:hypothetical protein